MAARRVGLTGHQRLTDETREKVLVELRDYLSRFAFEGICSLAEGADQLFAQTCEELGAKLTVVVPCDGYVDTFENPDSRDSYLHFLSYAASIVELGFPTPSEDAFLRAGHRVVEDSDVLLAVWNGQPAAGKGGTADVVEYARRSGLDVHVIWPEGAAREPSK